MFDGDNVVLDCPVVAWIGNDWIGFADCTIEIKYENNQCLRKKFIYFQLHLLRGLNPERFLDSKTLCYNIKFCLS